MLYYKSLAKLFGFSLDTLLHGILGFLCHIVTLLHEAARRFQCFRDLWLQPPSVAGYEPRLPGRSNYKCQQLYPELATLQCKCLMVALTPSILGSDLKMSLPPTVCYG